MSDLYKKAIEYLQNRNKKTVVDFNNLNETITQTINSLRIPIIEAEANQAKESGITDESKLNVIRALKNEIFNIVMDAIDEKKDIIDNLEQELNSHYDSNNDSFESSIIIEIIKNNTSSNGLAFVPTIVQKISDALSTNTNQSKKILLDMNTSGEIELRPETSPAMLSSQEKDLCISTDGETLLSWIRVLP